MLSKRKITVKVNSSVAVDWLVEPWEHLGEVLFNDARIQKRVGVDDLTIPLKFTVNRAVMRAHEANWLAAHCSIWSHTGDR